MYRSLLRQNQICRLSKATELKKEEIHHHVLQFMHGARNGKQNTSDAIATTDEAMLQRIWQITEYHLDLLCATNGAHMEVYQMRKKKENC